MTEATSEMTRKSLHHLIVETAGANGLTVNMEHRSDMGGHNVYVLNGTDYTPGEMAELLGVDW